MKLNKIAKMVRAEKSNEVAQQFVNDLIYTIEKENESDYIPTKAYKPSGIAGCKRSLYYQMIGTQPDEQSSGVNLVGICLPSNIILHILFKCLKSSPIWKTGSSLSLSTTRSRIYI